MRKRLCVTRIGRSASSASRRSASRSRTMRSEETSGYWGSVPNHSWISSASAPSTCWVSR